MMRREQHDLFRWATFAVLRDALLPKLISGALCIADGEKIVGRAV